MARLQSILAWRLAPAFCVAGAGLLALAPVSAQALSDGDKALLDDVSDAHKLCFAATEDDAVNASMFLTRGWTVLDDDNAGRQILKHSATDVLVRLRSDDVRACIVIAFTDNPATERAYMDFFPDVEWREIESGGYIAPAPGRTIGVNHTAGNSPRLTVQTIIRAGATE